MVRAKPRSLILLALTGDLCELGEWKGTVSLPPKQTLESLEMKLTGEDKELFLNLIRNLLSWLPEERPPLLHAFFHKWLRGDIS